ncbi:MAG: hypothetical protein KatS3mg113_0322 [Planctomycetaceae bacterium]|nr:MAG: hypothetical protein KatS3mg113_0322 [Planctomycetaceae bacterium]
MSDQPSQPLTSHKQVDFVTVIRLEAPCRLIEEPLIESLQDELLGLAQNLYPPVVVLDLSLVEFFSSSFIEVLFRVWNRLQQHPDGKMVLASVHPYCREVLEVTHLDKLWPIYHTANEAVKTLASS